MPRFETYVDDGTVFVGAPDGHVRVGDLEAVVDAVGGPAWTITYSEGTRQRHPELNTADEGLTVDVVDMCRAMTHGERFVAALEAQPTVTESDDDLSPRLGLFVGKLLENLEEGVS